MTRPSMCGCHSGRTRLLDLPEPFPDLAIAVLIRLARGCLCACRVMVIEEVSQSLRDAVAASRAPPESAAFNHEIELGTGCQNEPAGARLSAVFRDGSAPRMCDLRGYPVGAGDRPGGLVRVA